MSHSSITKQTATRSGKPRRWIMRLFRVMLGLALVTAIAFFLVTRSWFIIRLVKPHLERRFGGEVAIGNASYKGHGQFIFDDLELRVPGMEGDAGLIARLQRLDVVIDTTAIRHREFSIKNVDVYGLHIRLSEDAQQSGDMNFMKLTPFWDDGPTLPPAVRIHHSVIEVGSHVDSDYSPRGLRLFTGILYPLDLEKGLFNFTLNEIDENFNPINPNGLQVRGNWNANTFELSGLAEGLQLNNATYRMCPSIVRVWWEQMELEGHVYGVSFHYLPEESMEVRFSIQDVAMSLPIKATDLWATYQDGKIQSSISRPRMFVRSGEISLSDNQVQLLDLVGTLGAPSGEASTNGLPFKVTFTIDSIPMIDWEHKGDWMRRVLDESPFNMTVEIENYVFERGDDGETSVVQLPAPIARVLEKFRLTQWTLDSSIVLRRQVSEGGATDDTPDSPEIEVNGSISLKNGRGAYDIFPYQLENIQARAEFDTNRVVIHELTATGSNGAQVRVTGQISPLGPNAAISLQVSAQNVAFDQRLRDALSEKQQRLYDASFHEQNYETLRAHGLLDEKSDFVFGGSMDLDLNFERPAGPDQNVVMTGEVDIHSLGIVHESFPYPITVHGGRLELLADRVVLVGDDDTRGLPISTQGGGKGFIKGEITYIRKEGKFETRPELSMHIEQDGLTDLLYASIPLSSQERKETDKGVDGVWPGTRLSRTGKMLQGLGLDGSLDYEGVLRRNDDGQFDYDIRLTLNGSAEPADKLADMIGTVGLIWPDEFLIDDVHGVIKITPDYIELQNFSGRNKESTITADGFVDLASPRPESFLHINFERLALGPYLVNLAPAERRDEVRQLWEKYQPSGHFSLDLNYHAVGDTVDRMELQVFPDEINLILDDQLVILTREEGDIKLVNKQVEFDNLFLMMKTGDRSDGTITLNGAYDTSQEESDLNVLGIWQDGRLESPLVTEMLSLIGAESQIEYYRKLSPHGRFQANFSYESPRSGRVRKVDISLEPLHVSVQLNDRTIAMDFKPGSKIVFEPGLVLLRNISGQHNGGSFNLDGTINFKDEMDINLVVEYNGRLRSPEIEALLPERIRQWVELVKFQDSEESSLRHGTLHLQEVRDEEGNTQWKIDFTGRIETANAGFVAGGEFAEVEGVFAVIFNFLPNQLPVVKIDADIHRMLVKDRVLTGITGSVFLDQDEKCIRVPHLKGDMYGGKIVGSASIGFGDNLDYQVNIDMVGVGLDGFLHASANPDDTRSDSHSAPAISVSPPLGEIFGTVALSGKRGRKETQIGRGMALAVGRRVAFMPLILRLAQILQLKLPVGGDLNYAAAEFYIAGEMLYFEELFFENSVGDYAIAPLQLIGSGTLDLKSFELDLKFQARGGLMLINEVIGSFGDQLLGIEITGPLSDPQANIVALPGLSRAESKSHSPGMIVNSPASGETD
ncbi:MAG: hypothetical protein IID30_02135 [Planctomycetes bacterium]|nr:hypothetical protein [Planctomycetota bacterium]